MYNVISIWTFLYNIVLIFIPFRLELASSLDAAIDMSDVYVNVDAYKHPQLHNTHIDNLLLKPGQKQEVCTVTSFSERLVRG